MTTIAEQIRKEDEAFKKATASHRARLKKLEDATYKRIFKQLKKTVFFEIEFTDTYWRRTSKGGKTKVPPSLKLWVGNSEYSIGQFMSLKKPELLWLAQELSQWFDVPVTRTHTNAR